MNTLRLLFCLLLTISKANPQANPLDNYIDPMTQLDYTTVWDTLNPDVKKLVKQRCSMFNIQKDMAAMSSERNMTPAEIDSYERMIAERCKCIEDGKIYEAPPAGSSAQSIMQGGTCKPSNPLTYTPEARENGTYMDLFLYTMNACIDTMLAGTDGSNCQTQNDSNSQTNAASTTAATDPSNDPVQNNCRANFMAQCYSYIIEPQKFYQPVNIPDNKLGKCTFEDQTKILKMSCRSWCYMHTQCDLGAEDAAEGKGALIGVPSDFDVSQFQNRKISNIYLIDQISNSSCIKDTSFGIHDDNSIWVNNSCYGNFGIQFKDPDCGFRPYCPIQPHVTENANLRGTGYLRMKCDGQAATLDPNTNKKKRMFCKVWPLQADGTSTSPVNLTDDTGTDTPDESIDEKKRITSITLVNRVTSSATVNCVDRGTGAPATYGSIYVSANSSSGSGSGSGTAGMPAINQDHEQFLADMTNEYAKESASGWGIFVDNGCSSTFDVTYAWEVSKCSKAGESVGSGCCLGLADVDGKCRSPITEELVPNLTDPEQLGFSEKNRCEKSIVKSIQQRAQGYMAELALYENLFATLDGQNDSITKLRQGSGMGMATLPDDTPNEVTPAESQNNSLKNLHDAFVLFRNDYNKVMKGYYTANDKINRDMLYFNEAFAKIEDKKMMPSDLLAENPLLDRLFFVREPTGVIKKGPDGQPLIVNTQLVALSLQLDGMVRNQLNAAGLSEVFKNLKNRLWGEVQNAADILWLCAHDQDCAGKSWLVTDLDMNNLDAKVIDVLHDPPHAYLHSELNSSIGQAFKSLPNTTGSNAKYLVSQNSVKPSSTFMDWMTNYLPYNTYFDFNVGVYSNELYTKNAEIEEWNSTLDAFNAKNPTLKRTPKDLHSIIADAPGELKKIFVRYTVEVPIRDDSPYRSDSYLSSYANAYTTGINNEYSNFNKTVNFDASRKDIPVPYYCSQMTETEEYKYDVRIPIGRLVEVIRAYQLAEYFEEYYMKYYHQIYQTMAACLYEQSSQGDGSGGVPPPATIDLAVAGSDGQGPLATHPLLSNATANFFGTLAGSFGDIGSTLAGAGATIAGSTVKSTSSAGTLGTSGGALAAAGSKLRKLSKADLLAAAKRRGDQELVKHLDSLESTLNRAIASRGALTPATTTSSNASLVASAAPTSLGDGAQSASAINSNDAFMADQLKKLKDNSGRGRGGDSGGRSGGSSSSSSDSGSSSQANGDIDDGMWRDINSSKFNPHPDDSIWQTVTKRYFRSGFPRLMDRTR